MIDYQNILDQNMQEANQYLENPSKLDALMAQLEEKLREIPAIGASVSELPVMVSMVNSWIKKEYAVSPKVLATMVAAFLYLVKKRDLIPDNIPVLGIADDVAVLGLALKFVENDVKAYKAWKASV